VDPAAKISATGEEPCRLCRHGHGVAESSDAVGRFKTPRHGPAISVGRSEIEDGLRDWRREAGLFHRQL